ncbi:MAG TPA: hypothetical protein DHW76_07370, partial [Clostridiaceae bacterium]|nr:hypothetical protein [Clostridiaceae bacterium]
MWENKLSYNNILVNGLIKCCIIKTMYIIDRIGGKYMKRIVVVFLFSIMLITPLMNGCSKVNKKDENKKTIKFYTMHSTNEQGKIYSDIIKKYEKSNPEVKIEIQEITSDEDKLKQMISNGDVDLAGIKRNQLIEYAKSGYLMDLTDFIETNELKDRLYKIALAYGKYNGKTYGIGDSPIAMEIYYNKDIFDKCGINEPANLEEFISACSKLKNGGVAPFEIGALDTWTLSLYYGTITSQTTGAKVFTDLYGSDSRSMSNINGLNNAFSIYNSVCSKCIPKDCIDINYKQCVTDFVNGKTAMIPGGTFTVKLIDEMKHSNFNYDVIKEPIKYVDEPISSISASAGEVLVIPSNSKNAEDAKKFLKYIFSEEAQNIYTSNGYVSSLKTANKSKNDVEKVLLEHIEKADENSIAFTDNLEPNVAENAGRILQELFEG